MTSKIRLNRAKLFFRLNEWLLSGQLERGIGLYVPLLKSNNIAAFKPSGILEDHMVPSSSHWVRKMWLSYMGVWHWSSWEGERGKHLALQLYGRGFGSMSSLGLDVLGPDQWHQRHLLKCKHKLGMWLWLYPVISLVLLFKNLRWYINWSLSWMLLKTITQWNTINF